MEKTAVLQDVAPWKRVRYLIVFLITSGVTVAFATRISLSIGIVAMTDNKTNEEFETFDWDQSTQSTMLSAFFWGYVITNVPAGLLIQKFGIRWFLLGGHFFSAVVSLLIPLTSTSWGWEGLCALRVIQGLSQGAIFPSLSALLAKWAPPSEVGRLGSICFSGMQAGNFFALPISGALASSSGGWPSIYYLFGGLSLVWCVLWVFLGFDSPAEHPSITEKEKTYIESFYGKTTSTSSFNTPFLKIGLSIPMWALTISHSVQCWGYYMLLTEMPSYMSHILEFNIKDNGLLAALPYIVMFFGIFLSAWLSDLLISREILQLKWTRKLFNTIGFIGPMCTMIGLSYVGLEERDLAVALLVISCGLNAGVYVGFQVNHVELSPNFGGVLMGITNSLGNCVSLVVPLVVGAVVTDQESEDQWHTIFWITAGAYLLGSVAYLFFSSNEVQPWNETKQEKSTVEDAVK